MSESFKKFYQTLESAKLVLSGVENKEETRETSECSIKKQLEYFLSTFDHSELDTSNNDESEKKECSSSLLSDLPNHALQEAKIVYHKPKEPDNQAQSVHFKIENNFKKLFNFLAHFKKEEQELVGNELANHKAVEVIVESFKVLLKLQTEHSLKENNFESFGDLLKICSDFSNVSSVFCRKICELGIVPSLITLLKSLQSNISQIPESLEVVSAALVTLFNCSKLDENEDFFHSADIIETMAWYARNNSSETIASVAALTLAHIIDENNNICLEDNPIIKTIVQRLLKMMISEDHTSCGSGVYELMSCLTRLANNDTNSFVMVQNGIFQCIQKILKKGNDDEKVEATKAIWALTFTDEIKTKILNETDFLPLLKTLSSSSTNHENQNLKRSVDGALWLLEKRNKLMKLHEKTEVGILQQNQEIEAVIDIDDGKIRSDKHVMISYQWDCQHQMIKLKKCLKKCGYKVWMDLDEMEGSTLQAMADAVENSAVILIGLSRKYKISPSCRTEAEYAFTRRIPIIPLKVEQGYRPDGWLGAIVGSKLYYDLTNETSFDETTLKLTKEIGDRGKQVECQYILISQDSVQSMQENLETQNEDIKESEQNFDKSRSTTEQEQSTVVDKSYIEWNNLEVIGWLNENKVENINTKSLDGEILKFLKDLNENLPETFHRYLKDYLEFKNIKCVKRFIDALNNLHE